AVDMYHFHGEPLIVAGGRYNLCWCGPPPQGITRVPGKDYRQPDGIIPPPCPAVRAEDGGAFLSPGGKLVVVGPAGQPDSSCRLGVDCVVPRVLGEGLQGSDRVAALPSCGQAARPPLGWAQGAEVMGPGWTDAGWMTHGPYLPQELLSAFGAPGVAPTGTGNASDRGVYGFPNMGLSVASSKVGYVSWEGPVWAFAGTYLLCWCGADATTVGCKSPADYLVPIGRLIVTGPAVLPLAAQQFRCVRMRQCEIAHVEGTLPPASQLGVAEMECGTAAPVGMASPCPPQMGTTSSGALRLDLDLARMYEEFLRTKKTAKRKLVSCFVLVRNLKEHFPGREGTLVEMDPTLSLSEQMRSELMLELANISHQEILVIRITVEYIFEKEECWARLRLGKVPDYGEFEEIGDEGEATALNAMEELDAESSDPLSVGEAIQLQLAANAAFGVEGTATGPVTLIANFRAQKGKGEMDEDLEGGEQRMLLGKYKAALAIFSTDGAAALWLAGGPVILAGCR
ncbi:unnamed protein product, partial [Effrenium voratum]